MEYVLKNFFTHKDYLIPASEIPGTLFTPLHFVFAICLMCFILWAVRYVLNHRELILPVFKGIWVFAVIFEFIVVGWESLAGIHHGLDVQTNLSLYPCSLFLYTMPFAIWGKGIAKKIACGYICTLGFVGGAVNFIYPAIRLASYSCISFIGFHTFFFHGSMVFVWLVMLGSGYYSYKNVKHIYELFLPCIPTLLLSIPANIVNYSKINADYMLFRGQLPLFQVMFGNLEDIQITLIMYAAYIFIPALFYLPSLVVNREKYRDESIVWGLRNKIVERIVG